MEGFGIRARIVRQDSWNGQPSTLTSNHSNGWTGHGVARAGLVLHPNVNDIFEACGLSWALLSAQSSPEVVADPSMREHPTFLRLVEESCLLLFEDQRFQGKAASVYCEGWGR